jgi:hypothetical protein
MFMPDANAHGRSSPAFWAADARWLLSAPTHTGKAAADIALQDAFHTMRFPLLRVPFVSFLSGEANGKKQTETHYSMDSRLLVDRVHMLQEIGPTAGKLARQPDPPDTPPGVGEEKGSL